MNSELSQSAFRAQSLDLASSGSESSELDSPECLELESTAELAEELAELDPVGQVAEVELVEQEVQVEEQKVLGDLTLP